MIFLQKVGGSVALQRSWLAGIAAAVLAFPSLAASAATAVGDAASVVRLVSGELEGRKRPVRVGEKVFQNETIRTEQDSQARLTLLDKTSLWIGAAATIKLDRFVYDPARPSVIVSALKGAVRWTSGALPSPSYKINTPHLSLGVRGTTFDVLVGRTETVVVLVEGAVTVCSRQGGRPCHTLDKPGAVSIGNAAGVQGPSSARSRSIDLPGLYQRLGGSFLNPLAQALPTRIGEIPGLPGVRLDAARHLSGPQNPLDGSALIGGEASSVGGSITFGSGGVLQPLNGPANNVMGAPAAAGNAIGSPALPAATGVLRALPLPR